MFRANPSPDGRGCREAAGEGYNTKNSSKSFEEMNVVPLTRPADAGHPLPSGEGFAPNLPQFGQLCLARTGNLHPIDTGGFLQTEIASRLSMQRRSLLVLIASFIMLLAGVQAQVPQVPSQRRPGTPPPPPAQTTPAQSTSPVPQTQATPSDSPFKCTEPVNVDRDQNGRAISSACGSIEGVVVRASSSIGIANAHVALAPPNAGENAVTLETLTDSSGRYIFPSINPAAYTLSVIADGYAPAVFGQPGSLGSGEIFNLTGGTHFHADFKLNPYQTASGTVRTADGLPVAAAVVRAYRVRYSLLGRRMKIVKTVLSNDAGDYRLFGLEPGDYYFSASYSERARDIPLFGATLTPNLSNPDSGYVTQYYPAAVSPPDATAVTMTANEEKTNLNFTLKEVERFKVHVSVFAASTAQSHHFNIAMMPEGAELEDASEYVVHRAEETDGGDFVIKDVGAGHYSLVAFDKARILSEPTPITVNRDIEARVTVYDPVDIPGVIVDEAGNPFPGKWSVRLVRADPDIGQTIRVDADSGSFVMPDVGPASFDVYVDGLPLGNFIKEVQFPLDDGTDKFGRIRIEPEKPKRILDPNTQRWRTEAVIRVVLAGSDLIVLGQVSKEPFRLEAVPGVQLVLEPDLQPGSPYRFREDRFIFGTTNSAGFFRWVGVPEGVYFMFPFMEIPAGLYFDSQFNQRIFNRGIRVTVTEGRSDSGKIFEIINYCSDRYRDPTYPKPTGDATCMVPIPREESVGVSR